jgi:hypothetical protein
MEPFHTDEKIATRQNWIALKKLAQEYLADSRMRHPEWTLEDVLNRLDLPKTAMVTALVDAAGFRIRAEPTATEIGLVMSQFYNGVHSDEVISKQCGIVREKVCRILESCIPGYGKTPYGGASYGNNRAVSKGELSVCRHTTAKGQLSYRGHRYSLGSLYGGRAVYVKEVNNMLVISCNDRPPLQIRRYFNR